MSFDEQPYDKADHDLHETCEEIKRLRAQLDEAKADTWDEAIQLLMDWMGKRGELATVKSEIRCLFEARSLRDRGGR